MNIDLASTLAFGDIDGFRNFFLVHRIVHDEEAAAFGAKLNVTTSTFGVQDSSAEEAWSHLMKSRPGTKSPQSLINWLYLHAQIHIQAYDLLGGTPTAAPDLSQVDFSSPDQFYDWMYVHQQMHDYEQQTLGIT